MFKVSGLWFGVSSLGLRVSHLGTSATAQCPLELSTVYRLVVLAERQPHSLKPSPTANPQHLIPNTV